MKKRQGLALAAMLLVAAMVFSLSAQLAVSQEREGRQGRRGDFDPARWMERMMERQKEELGSTDEEWKIIEPLMKKVNDARMEMRAGGPGFGRRRGGEAPADSGFPEYDALRKAVDTEGTSNEDIKAKLTAYREALKKKEANLEKAREDLRKVLTVKQEAILVLRGTLD
jgi:hypothetical protein